MCNIDAIKGDRFEGNNRYMCQVTEAHRSYSNGVTIMAADADRSTNSIAVNYFSTKCHYHPVSSD